MKFKSWKEMTTSDRVFFCIGIAALVHFIFHAKFAHAKEVRVLVIDTGIDPTTIEIMPYLEPSSNYDDMDDERGHGTHVAGIIASSGCPNLKIVSCKYFNIYVGSRDKLHDCYQRLLNERFDIVNFSGGGDGFDPVEFDLLKKASAKGIKINVAAGNDGKNLGSPCFNYFPACLRLPNMTVVGSVDSHDRRSSFSDYGIPEMKWEAGENILSNYPRNRMARASGTSQATAMFTRHMVQEMCYQ